MTAAVEKMAYAGTKPWMGIGEEVKDTLSPSQMLKAAGLDWTVSKRPLFIEPQGKKRKPVKVPGRFGLTRDSDDRVLSIVGSTYKPVQNDEAFEFFKEFVKAGKMKMQHAGSLAGGGYIWAMASFNKDFTIGKDDRIKANILLLQPHIHGKAMVIQFMPIRQWCWNTLPALLGTGLRNQRHRFGAQAPNSFRMIHTRKFDEAVKMEAAHTLELASAQMDEFKEAANLLAKKAAKPEAVEAFFCDVLKYDPKKGKKNKDGSDREPRMLPQFRDALEKAPGQDAATAAGKWWGALNAVTYVIDHEIGNDRGTALKTAWIGNKAAVKRRAFELAVKAAQ